MPKKYPREVDDRVVRVVVDRLADCPSPWAACQDLAPKLDVGAETRRRWVASSQIDAGVKAGASTAALEEIARLKRERRDLKRRTRF